MRTAIFLGLLGIADAIRKDWLTGSDVIQFVAIIVVVMAFMDMFEFIHNLKKK